MKFTIYILDKGKFNREVVDFEEDKYKLVIGKIELQIEHIVATFKKLFNEGVIKSLAKPRNKKIQKSLDELIKIKKTMRDDIKKIKYIFANI